MEAILSFASHANSTILLCLCLIIIIMLLISKDGFSNFSKLFKKQDLTTMKVEGGNATLNSISKQLDKIAGNHLHELPEMSQNINKIATTVDAIQKKQNTDSDRISRMEGFLKIGL